MRIPEPTNRVTGEGTSAPGAASPLDLIRALRIGFADMLRTMAEPDPLESYSNFLQSAIRRYWDRKGSSKVTFLALMLATRHAWGVAVDRGLSAESGKRALSGAAGVAAVGVVIRLFLGGPLGLLLAGASAVSLLAVYGRNQEAIWRKVARFRGLIDEYELKYLELSERKGNDDDRNLMLEGLMARFLDELDTIPPQEEEPEPEPKLRGFAAHVAKQREEE